jgi:DNA-binding MurR/RpiR family transcriptional regulator
MTGVELRIKNGLERFNASEKKIAGHLLDHPEDALGLPIAKFAEHCDTSQAAVVRFCKKLGFDGFKGVKGALTRELMHASGNTLRDEDYSDIKPSDTPGDIVGKITAGHIRALEETAKVLDAEALAQAADLVLQAGRVDVFGFGASGLVALDLQQKLTRIGKMCLAYQDVHMQFTAAASLTEKDAAVFISYSGETKDIVACLRFVRERGVKSIAITKYNAGRLGKMADLVLSVCSPEITLRSGAMSSRVAQLAIVDMLFVSIAGRAYGSAQEVLQRSHDSVLDKRYK